MRSINKVILIGNLTRNPETKEVQNGQKITTFSLATNRRWITSGSEEKTSTEYHDCVAWAKLADICDRYLTKGKLVYVEGYLKTRSWTNEEGVKKFRTEVVVQDLIMLDKKGETTSADEGISLTELATEESSDIISEEAAEKTDDAPSEAEMVTPSETPTEDAVVAEAPAEEKQEENVF